MTSVREFITSGLRLLRKKPSLTEPIFVYQMGKVGSTSVAESLQAMNLRVPVHHLHLLNNLDEIEKEVRDAYPNPHDTLLELNKGRSFRKQIENEQGKQWNLISMVREPVARNVSAFFENITQLIPDIRLRYASGQIAVGEVLQTFLYRYKHNGPAEWFDTQMKDVFGIDVFAETFPFDTGYAFYASLRARLLLMRLENLNACVKSAMQEFLGIKDFQLLSVNVGEEKTYGNLYNEFKQLALPERYLDEMYNSRFARHFYREEELKKFKAQWLKKN